MSLPKTIARDNGRGISNRESPRLCGVPHNRGLYIYAFNLLGHITFSVCLLCHMNSCAEAATGGDVALAAAATVTV